MFKALYEILRKEDLLQEAYTASVEMLKLDRQMFEAAYKSLRGSENGEIPTDIYTQDAKINQYQREVRRKVLAHMIASPSRDIVFGLILVSIVIDIERIGDYMKNIVELAEEHPRKLTGGPFAEEIADIETQVTERFDLLLESFEKSDVDLALAVMRKHPAITQRCDNILKSMLSEEHQDLCCVDAVSIALYVRYLKRVSSHITNIASGIANPFDRIGFRE